MKVLFVHLSDLHLDSSRSKDIDVNALVASLSNLGDIDKCFLLFTGDFTQSSKRVDFECFNSLIENIIEKIKSTLKTEVVFIGIPGNHDYNLFSKRAPKIEEIHDAYSKGERYVNNLFNNYYSCSSFN